MIPNQDHFKDLLKVALLKEIEMRALDFAPKKIHSIYFGGGTPALVGPIFIHDILTKIKTYTSIDNIEITLEINPENYDLNLLQAFYQLGINRLSIGAQSFDDDLLTKLNRSHSAKEIHLAIANASQAGFKNISIDLMYELPHQTLKSWKKTLLSIPSSITHISLYNLSIEPHTVFYKYKEKIQKKMPRQDIAIKMYEEAKEIFESLEFNHYEISAFCKNDLYSKHNVGYWLQRPHLGFGPSAFSFFEKRRFQNAPNIHRYSQSILENKDPSYFVESLKDESFLKESLALHLRLINGFDMKIFQKRFGLFSDSLKKMLQNLINQNLLIKKGSFLKLSSSGILFHDHIASEII